MVNRLGFLRRLSESRVSMTMQTRRASSSSEGSASRGETSAKRGDGGMDGHNKIEDEDEEEHEEDSSKRIVSNEKKAAPMMESNSLAEGPMFRDVGAMRMKGRAKRETRTAVMFRNSTGLEARVRIEG